MTEIIRLTGLYSYLFNGGNCKSKIQRLMCFFKILASEISQESNLKRHQKYHYLFVLTVIAIIVVGIIEKQKQNKIILTLEHVYRKKQAVARQTNLKI